MLIDTHCDHDVGGGSLAFGPVQWRMACTDRVRSFGLVMQVKIALIVEQQSVDGKVWILVLCAFPELLFEPDKDIGLCSEIGVRCPAVRDAGLVEGSGYGGDAGWWPWQHAFLNGLLLQFVQGKFGLLQDEFGQANDGLTINFALTKTTSWLGLGCNSLLFVGFDVAFDS